MDIWAPWLLVRHPWTLKCRDQFISGGPRRLAGTNLGRVVRNDRFLILPMVRVKNLLPMYCLWRFLRLSEDWEERYQIRPVLVETFVDPSRFGRYLLIRRANWTYVGDSAGRRDGKAKKIFFVSLWIRRGRQVLCVEPQISAGREARPEEPEHWAEEEFGTVRFL